MNSKVIIDTSAIDELLLDVLIQSCGNEDMTEIDNECLSAFESACDYLTERGYLLTSNGRMYKLTKKAIDKLK
jgi:hypothetical protein